MTNKWELWFDKIAFIFECMYTYASTVGSLYLKRYGHGDTTINQDVNEYLIIFVMCLKCVIVRMIEMIREHSY